MTITAPKPIAAPTDLLPERLSFSDAPPVVGHCSVCGETTLTADVAALGDAWRCGGCGEAGPLCDGIIC